MYAFAIIRTALVSIVLPVIFHSFVQPQLLAQTTVDVRHMERVATVDERFGSYNIEMVEVIGGRFWKPYGKPSAKDSASQTQESSSVPAGMDPNLYQYRPPIDLSNSRLRKLASALGPAYVRVSGTWANTVYFKNSDDSSETTAPSGFSGVLTRQQWKGVVDFAHAVNAEIVTSFATSPGTRDSKEVWIPEQAARLLSYTRSVGGKISAAEFMNEPTYAAMGAHRRVMMPRLTAMISLFSGPS